MALKYGLIGSGMMGQEHIRNINLMDGVSVGAIANPNPEVREQALKLTGGKAKAFADHTDMLSDDTCDAYVIATPNDTHHAILSDVLATNKPVLCEKPLCTTSVDCRDIIQKAATRSAPVWVALEYRYMPPIQQMLNELATAVVGTPRMMAIREHRYPFLEKVGKWNRFNARTGGTLVEKCCHFWDLMRLTLQSDPIRVYASAGVDVNHLDELYDGKTPDIIDNAFVIVDFESGARGMLDLCMFAEGSYWQETISITGEIARLDSYLPGPARFSKDGKERTAEIRISDRATKSVLTQTVEVDEEILKAGDHHGASYYQHIRFRDLILAGHGQPEVTLEDGLWSVLVGEAAEQSAQTGQSVDLR